jgi:hypothetical protein
MLLTSSIMMLCYVYQTSNLQIYDVDVVIVLYSSLYKEQLLPKVTESGANCLIVIKSTTSSFTALAREELGVT